MAMLTIAFGALLILMGLSAYFGATGTSAAALYPAVVGLLLVVCGVLALKESRRMHATHAAVLVALAGAIISGWRAARNMVAIFSDTSQVDMSAMFAGLTMFVVCTGYILLCVRSFIRARRLRKKVQDS